MDTPLKTPTYTKLNYSNMNISYTEFVALTKSHSKN